MYCNNCGKQIPDDAKFCDGCGVAVHAQQTVASPSTQFAHQSLKPKKTKNRFVLVVIALVFVIGLVGCIASIGSNHENKTDELTDQSTVEESTLSDISAEALIEIPSPSPKVTTDWLKYYEDNGDYVISAYADVMYEYGSYYAGYLACTVVDIYDIDSYSIKAYTDNTCTLSV